MRRKTFVVLGVLVVALLFASVVGLLWWRRAHTAHHHHLHPLSVASNVPARVRLLPVAGGLERPTDVQFVPGGAPRVVVLEQGGHARLLDLGPSLAGGKPADGHASPLVLDLEVRSVGEMGLLGLAFHPHYEQNGTIYVFYHPWIHDILRSRIAEFTLPAEALGKHPAAEKRVLLDLDQRVSIHQGGQLVFGSDGKLYVAIGDGSTANDPDGRAQNLGSLYGKLLRLDVDGPSLAPKDNPFAGRPGARPEIWAYGLRNPWRFSFTSTGKIVAGDVGQEAREEIDLITAGANLGWNKREGRICSQTTPTDCLGAGMTDPIHDYDRSVGSCVIGGYEVTGKRVPALTGKYVFADFVRGRIWSMTLPVTAPAAGAPPGDVHVELLGEWSRLFSAFGRDAAGDVYIADLATGELLALMPLK